MKVISTVFGKGSIGRTESVADNGISVVYTKKPKSKSLTRDGENIS